MIRQPALIPTCLAAAVIGIYGFSTITRLSKSLGKQDLKYIIMFSYVYSGNPLYRVSFLSYALMMTSSMIVNCLLPNQSQDTPPTGIAYFVSLVDLGLTSSIAYSFAINGLIDAGALKPLSLLTYMVSKLGHLHSEIMLQIKPQLRSRKQQWSFFVVYLHMVRFFFNSYCLVDMVHALAVGCTSSPADGGRVSFAASSHSS